MSSAFVEGGRRQLQARVRQRALGSRDTTRELVYKLQQHFGEGNQLIGVRLGHENNFMICLISLLSNVIDPALTLRRYITVIGQEFDVLNEGLARCSTLTHCDVHQELATGEYCCGVSARRDTVTRFFVKRL